MWDFAGEGWVHRLVLQKSDPWDEGTESPFFGEEVGSGLGLGLGYEEDVYSGHSIGNGEERYEGYGGHANRGGSSSGSGSSSSSSGSSGSGGGNDNITCDNDAGAKVTPINTHTFNNTYTPYTTQTQTQTQIQTLDQIPHRSVRIKLVEVPDPSSQLPHRTRVPPLSSDQTEVEINR